MTTDTSNNDRKSAFFTMLMKRRAWVSWMIVLSVLLLPFVIRGWKLRGVPDFPEPFDTGALLEYSVADVENAFTDYRKAISFYIPPIDEVNELGSCAADEGRDLTDDEIRRHLRENKAALEVWKRGTEKDLALYMPAKEYHLDIDLYSVQRMRELQRTVMLLCKQFEADGDPDEAWEWYRASIRASRQVGAHGSMIERLVGNALFAISAHHLETWATDPLLKSDDLQKSIKELQSIWTMTEKPSTTLQIEYLSFHQTLDNFMEGLNPAKDWLPVPPILMCFIGEPELSQRMSRIYTHNQLMFCDEVRNKRPQVVPNILLFDDPAGFSLGDYEWDKEMVEQAIDRAILASLLLPATTQFLNAIDREEARYRCLLVALATQAYFRDHGEFPADASQLVPKYLEEIPVDLYSPTPAPLIYRRNGNDAVVYSRFENELDDGGLALNHEEAIELELLDYDYGNRIRHPFSRPLVAPKPFRE